MLSIMPIFYKLFLTNLKFLSLKDVVRKFGANTFVTKINYFPMKIFITNYNFL